MYALTAQSNIIRRKADNAFIPADPRNADYAAYLAWIGQGNAPDAYTPPPASPVAAVSRFQAKAALLAAGLLPQVETLMAAASTPAVAKLAWAEALEFQRASPTIAAMATALGWSQQQLDDLFNAASRITA